MCTAATFLSDDFYFGRNLDYEFSYGDEVTVTPRGYAFSLRRGDTFRTRYAIIGMAYVQGDYPLYYDAINEKGLGVAGLILSATPFIIRLRRTVITSPNSS